MPDYQLRHTGAEVDEAIGKALALPSGGVYPVGSIYLSVNPTSPASLFGGTWEQIKGRFLVGTGNPSANSTNVWGAVNTDVNLPNGETGGEHLHQLTISEMPSHSHTTLVDMAATMGKVDGGYTYAISNSGTFPTGTSGDNMYHNNMPPYLVVYMWKRVP